MSRAKTVLSRRPSGTSPSAMRWARPSTMAVLPTPGSPMSTGLFFVLRDRIWITRRISPSRPMTGSSLPARGVGDQVAAVLLQRLVGDLGHRRGDPLVAADRGERLQEPVPGEALLAQQPAGGGRRRPRRAARSRRCSTETYSSLSRFASRSAASSSRDSRWVTKTWPGAAPGPVTRGPAAAARPPAAPRSRSGSAPAAASSRGHQPVGLVEQGQQQVLAVDLGVAEAQRLGLRVVQGLLGLLGQAVQVHGRASGASR